MKGKRVGWLGVCSTPYCGSIHGYFCVRCRHFTSECACQANSMFCECEDQEGWAGEGERKQVAARVAAGRDKE